MKKVAKKCLALFGNFFEEEKKGKKDETKKEKRTGK